MRHFPLVLQGFRADFSIQKCDTGEAASTANEAARDRRKTVTGPGRPALRGVIDQWT